MTITVERLAVPKTHPRRVATLAMAGSVRWGPDVSARLVAIEGSADALTADDEYLAGLAARAIASVLRNSR